jgi:hypothetical protein
MPVLPANIFHVADTRNWESIREHGLLCTDTIVRRSTPREADNAAVRAYRPAGVSLPNGVFIRDQKPMAPATLAQCLDAGVSPLEWCDLINRCVFFWADRTRMERHLTAQRGQSLIVLTFDTRKLLAAYSKAAFLTPFNVGNSRRRAAARGWRTLVPVDCWLSDGWASEASPGSPPRRSSHKPAELAIKGDAPDALCFLTACNFLNAPRR